MRVGNTPAGTQVARAGARFLFSLGVWGGLLFWAAGTLTWTRAWVHLGLWIATLVTNFAIILWKNPAGLATRMKRPQIGEKFDKVIVSCLLPATLAIPVLAGLDAVRYQWALLPLWPVSLGAVLHIAGDAFILWSMIVNPYLEGGVRIQSECGHRVITTGPYAFVRHPMYVGFILVLAGIPLVLGSSWTFLPVGIVALLLVVRTVFEDRMLREELPGYEDYTQKTRRRLLPGIW
ncbi:MAG: isoprenylcysteine carboxylmethyltransferase family protein [Phycisphaerae bacterium]|nr:isoprenylcysteine carboxylmethyltransferase family protein [Phycisphaerae bacterium]